MSKTATKKDGRKVIGHLCFTISGEFLTEHFRDRVLEGNWTEAIKGLMDSLIGISYDQVTTIL